MASNLFTKTDFGFYVIISPKSVFVNGFVGKIAAALAKPPYGHREDPDDKKQWIADKEAAEVIKRIFALRPS